MNFYHRPHRLLLDAKPGTPPTNEGRTNNYYRNEANFDTNMVIILAALLCALICALGLNSIVRCILRCSRRMGLESLDETPSRIGFKGLKKRALRQIPVAVYGSGNGIIQATECPICLGEFVDGEKIRVLPKCHHCFHVRCIDIWLSSHSSCPTCRQSLVEPATSCDGTGVCEVRQGGNAAEGSDSRGGDLPPAGSADDIG